MIGFKNSEIFLLEMGIELVSRMQGEKKRVVGVVCVQNQERAEIEGVVSWNGRKIGVKKVVTFFIQLSVVDTEVLVKLGGGNLDLGEVLVEQHYGE